MKIISKIIIGLSARGIIYIPDKLYLKILYKRQMEKPLKVDLPQTFNEKLQWLKLYNRQPVYTKLVDKYRVRDFVTEKIGKEYLIPLLGVYQSFNEIDFLKLPNQFVLKCNHDSGGVVICKDKKFLNKDEVKRKITRSLKHNYYLSGREWPYKNVKACIIVEKYMVDECGTELKDYKIFCFNGEPQIIQIDYDRFTNHHRNLFDTSWNPINVTYMYSSDKTRIFKRPALLDDMLKLAKKLAEGIPFVRTDFYIINNKIYFGEMTFFPEGGFAQFNPEIFDEQLGQKLELSI